MRVKARARAGVPFPRHTARSFLHAIPHCGGSLSLFTPCRGGPAALHPPPLHSPQARTLKDDPRAKRRRAMATGSAAAAAVEARTGWGAAAAGVKRGAGRAWKGEIKERV